MTTTDRTGNIFRAASQWDDYIGTVEEAWAILECRISIREGRFRAGQVLHGEWQPSTLRLHGNDYHKETRHGTGKVPSKKKGEK